MTLVFAAEFSKNAALHVLLSRLTFLSIITILQKA